MQEHDENSLPPFFLLSLFFPPFFLFFLFPLLPPLSVCFPPTPGEEQQIEPDLIEEAVRTDSDQVVPDPQEERSMVATSAEVYTCFLVSDCSNTIVYLMDLFFAPLFSIFPLFFFLFPLLPPLSVCFPPTLAQLGER